MCLTLGAERGGPLAHTLPRFLPLSARLIMTPWAKNSLIETLLLPEVTNRFALQLPSPRVSARSVIALTSARSATVMYSQGKHPTAWCAELGRASRPSALRSPPGG
jgi:hypothetical protein